MGKWSADKLSQIGASLIGGMVGLGIASMLSKTAFALSPLSKGIQPEYRYVVMYVLGYIFVLGLFPFTFSVYLAYIWFFKHHSIRLEEDEPTRGQWIKFSVFGFLVGLSIGILVNGWAWILLLTRL